MDVSSLTEDTSEFHQYMEQQKSDKSEENENKWRRSNSPDYIPNENNQVGSSNFQETQRNSNLDIGDLSGQNRATEFNRRIAVEQSQPSNSGTDYLLEKYFTQYQEHQPRSLKRTTTMRRSRSQTSPVFRMEMMKRKPTIKGSSDKQVAHYSDDGANTSAAHAKPNLKICTSESESKQLPSPNDVKIDEDKQMKIEKAKCNCWANLTRNINFLDSTIMKFKDNNYVNVLDTQEKAVESAQAALNRLNAIKIRGGQRMEEKSQKSKDPEMQAMQAAQRKLDRLKRQLQLSMNPNEDNISAEDSNSKVQLDIQVRKNTRDESKENQDGNRKAQRLDAIAQGPTVIRRALAKSMENCPHTQSTPSEREDNIAAIDSSCGQGDKKKTTPEMKSNRNYLNINTEEYMGEEDEEDDDENQPELTEHEKMAIKRATLDLKQYRNRESKESEATKRKYYTDDDEEYYDQQPPFTQDEHQAITAAMQDLQKYKHDTDKTVRSSQPDVEQQNMKTTRHDEKDSKRKCSHIPLGNKKKRSVLGRKKNPWNKRKQLAIINNNSLRRLRDEYKKTTQKKDESQDDECDNYDNGKNKDKLNEDHANELRITSQGEYEDTHEQFNMTLNKITKPMNVRRSAMRPTKKKYYPAKTSTWTPTLELKRITDEKIETNPKRKSNVTSEEMKMDDKVSVDSHDKSDHMDTSENRKGQIDEQEESVHDWIGIDIHGLHSSSKPITTKKTEVKASRKSQRAHVLPSKKQKKNNEKLNESNDISPDKSSKNGRHEEYRMESLNTRKQKEMVKKCNARETTETATTAQPNLNVMQTRQGTRQGQKRRHRMLILYCKYDKLW